LLIIHLRALETLERQEVSLISAHPHAFTRWMEEACEGRERIFTLCEMLEQALHLTAAAAASVPISGCAGSKIMRINLPPVSSLFLLVSVPFLSLQIHRNSIYLYGIVSSLLLFSVRIRNAAVRMQLQFFSFSLSREQDEEEWSCR
jgi:hypothetical protein